MTDLNEAFGAVPVLAYTDHERYGPTVHRSVPEWIQREVTSLRVQAGHRVLEIGTGSGYSGALLARLCGPRGRVTSIDISEELINRARAIHAERGVTEIDCHVADGLAGFPTAAPFDRAVGWCTPPRLPRTWVEQITDGGRIVASLPIAPLPSTALITTITVDAGQPRVQAVVGGVYAQSTPAPVDDAVTVPGRWVDYCDRQPDPSWIAISWRTEDPHNSGARAALDRLLNPGHTETYGDMEADWRSWSAHTAAPPDPGLSMVSLRNQIRGIGHTTATSAAVILTDGTIIADTPDSASLTVLREWLILWQQAGRPTADSFIPRLVPNTSIDCPGGDLQLAVPADAVPASRAAIPQPRAGRVEPA
ncbi:protein-L-isoaspartate(D-aspartate) O-methyltransferase [Actinoplanes sp. SE50]|uniref:protein-L-isoaspartate O-methyltransferase family protein n=1 Tax=unclassified Actinoplanes TaxID=2626549 RepID=UPI00023EDD0B|nr:MULTISPECIES: methyltransferase domain-containing protein [unclassified Actinoplanes]AEV89118.1 Ubiquinone/menaquinone biosynthesis methyltransferase ubiE [Actinoplanes sp. SE50/110]ATO87524.1 protein-L-isoaspartate(D-aspartate) O-methyltransferase [Actinoplanes sp. SE50]SLM04942.1 protein-L-isoaspartate O-methyltransferase [Actinoplanes sp. SE50/110]